MRFMSVRTKLLAPTVGIIVGFVAVMLVMVSVLVRTIAEEEIAKDLEQGRRAFDFYMTSQRKQLLARAVALSDKPAAAEQHAIVIGPDGRCTVAVPGLVAAGADMHALRGVASALEGHVVDTVWRLGNAFLNVALAPVITVRRVTGVVAVAQPVDAALARDLRLVTGRDVVIRDGDQTMAESWAAESDREGELISLDIPFHQDGGTLVVSRSVGDLVTLTGRSFTWLIFAAVAVAAGGILLSLRLSRRLSAPLAKLMHASLELADGKLDTAVDCESHDEVGLLATSFNKMARRIECLVTDERSHAEQSERSNRAKDKFLSMVSHEMRTPLTSVRAYAELLLDYGKGIGEEETDFIRIIQSESDRLAAIINDLVDLVHIEADELVWKVESFDAGRLAQQIVGAVGSELSAKEVEWVAVVPDEPVEFCGDARRIEQACRQLMHNAWKFSPPGGRVTLEVAASGGCVELRVSDTGPGIPGEAAKRDVFEKFYQHGGSLTDKPSGTGLGLALASGIVAAHAGTIHCEDAQPRGAVFVVRLPAVSGGTRQVDQVHRDRKHHPAEPAVSV